MELNIYVMEKCIKCQNEFKAIKKSQKFCSVKCRNIFNTEKFRKDHNLHPKKVGRPASRWVAIFDMSEEDQLLWNKNNHLNNGNNQ